MATPSPAFADRIRAKAKALPAAGHHRAKAIAIPADGKRRAMALEIGNNVRVATFGGSSSHERLPAGISRNEAVGARNLFRGNVD